jgi:hypothetical protein
MLASSFIRRVVPASTPVLRRVAAISIVCAAVGVSTISPASAEPIITLYLVNYPSACATVQYNNNVSGTNITMYNCATSTSDKWVYITSGLYGPPACPPVGTYNCIQFQDPNNTGLCLGLPAGEGPAQLMPCYTDYADWVWSGSTLINATSYSRLFTTSASNGTQVYGQPPPPVFLYSWA